MDLAALLETSPHGETKRPEKRDGDNVASFYSLEKLECPSRCKDIPLNWRSEPEAVDKARGFVPPRLRRDRTNRGRVSWKGESPWRGAHIPSRPGCAAPGRDFHFAACPPPSPDLADGRAGRPAYLSSDGVIPGDIPGKSA